MDAKMVLSLALPFGLSFAAIASAMGLAKAVT